MSTTRVEDSELLMDVLSHAEVLTELQVGSLTRKELERRLDVSRATCYRYTNRLNEMDMVSESGEEITLTPLGETIAAEVTTFETTVTRTLQPSDEARDLFVEVVRLSPGLQALSRRPLDRRELEGRLDVSNKTVYRITRSLEDRELIEKSDGTYAITTAGTKILEAVSTFEANVQTAVRLGPVVEVLRETGPSVALDTFADATVTTIHGYTYSPQDRFLELVDETDTLRGVNTPDLLPFYLGDIQQRLVDGMELENVLRPEFVAEQLAEYPDRAIETCNLPNVTVYLHDDLWYSLVHFDNRIGIGVPDPDTWRVRAFVDTDSPAARKWAKAVYESYKAEAVLLPRFDPITLQQTIEEESLGEAPSLERL